MSRYIVYSITDPRDGHVFYIGVTNNLARRVTQHLATEPGKPSAKRIRELLQSDIVPTFSVLAKHATFQDARADELERIALVIIDGRQLNNAGYEIGDALRAYAQKHPPQKIGDSIP